MVKNEHEHEHVRSVASECSTPRYLANATTCEVYKEIARNSHIFDAEVEGMRKTFISPDFGNGFYLIEKFVEEIAKGGKAFAAHPNQRGCMQPLALAKDLRKMNSLLALYSPSKIYSPHVDLFFETFVIKHGLMPGFFSENPDEYFDFFKKTQGQFFNQLINEIFVIASQRAFKRKLYRRKEAIKRGYASGRSYLDALYERYARLLVLRVDFGFRTGDPRLPHIVELLEAQNYLVRFLNNKRGKKLYANLTGYLWRLEYGKEKGYHFHLFFFFDGSKAHKDEHLASEIGADWIRVTDGKGIYHNCNAHKQRYKRLGIGMISHDDEEKRRNLLEVLAYMHKEDQTLREKHADKTHGWGRGAMPRPRSNLSGRPRR